MDGYTKRQYIKELIQKLQKTTPILRIVFFVLLQTEIYPVGAKLPILQMLKSLVPGYLRTPRALYL